MRKPSRCHGVRLSGADRKRLAAALETAGEARVYRRVEALLLVAEGQCERLTLEAVPEGRPAEFNTPPSLSRMPNDGAAWTEAVLPGGRHEAGGASGPQRDRLPLQPQQTSFVQGEEAGDVRFGASGRRATRASQAACMLAVIP